MRLIRFNLLGRGPRLGVLLDENRFVDLTALSGGIFSSVQELFQESAMSGSAVEEIIKVFMERDFPEVVYDYHRVAAAPLKGDEPYLLMPIVPPEVWAAGVTYKRSVEARVAESQVSSVYDKVYDAERPEIFFKATAARVAGPGETIGLRADSQSIVPEPELGVVLGADLSIAGYVIGNDVTCRDIEGENPLYLPQAKLFKNSCSIGPILALTESLPDPYNLTISCTVYRTGEIVFTDTAHTGQLKRKLSELVDFLKRDNPLLPGTVLLTGTCIVPPDSFTLMPGDEVRIAIDLLGVLVNPVAD